MERLVFHSDEARLVGDLRLPPGEPPQSGWPGVVFCAGMSLTKEVWLPRTAEALNAAGYATLNFDYASFGESEGEPRRRLQPWRQVRDARHALTALAAQDNVDGGRMALFGASLGASVTLGACLDPRVRAAVAVAGPAHLGRVWRAFPGFTAFQAKVAAARERYVCAGEVSYVSVAKLLKSDPETVALLEAECPGYEHWSLEVTFESLLDLFEFGPEETLPDSRAALLLIYPEDDALIARSEAESAYALATGSKRIVALPGARHVAIYEPHSPASAQVTRETLAWLAEHLGPVPQGVEPN